MSNATITETTPELFNATFRETTDIYYTTLPETTTELVNTTVIKTTKLANTTSVEATTEMVNTTIAKTATEMTRAPNTFSVSFQLGKFYFFEHTNYHY